MGKRKWNKPTTEYINGKWVITKSYDTWNGMMKRCQDNGKFQQKYPSYTGCYVCDEWLDYDVFYDWFNEHYVDGYHLDKDILIKGNKIYSPDTCSFVPPQINLLFIKRNKNRGDLPIGVSFNKQNKKFVAKCNNGSGKQIHLGLFVTIQEAFEAYKQYKENLIKQIAEEYYTKGLIEKRLYNAMINYQVEIDD